MSRHTSVNEPRPSPDEETGSTMSITSTSFYPSAKTSLSMASMDESSLDDSLMSLSITLDSSIQPSSSLQDEDSENDSVFDLVFT
jgi:hypothetical protein